jgi:hypothetical protein
MTISELFCSEKFDSPMFDLKPKPRRHLGAIIDELSILSRLGKLADKSVEVALPALAERHVHRDVLANDRFAESEASPKPAPTES